MQNLPFYYFLSRFHPALYSSLYFPKVLGVPLRHSYRYKISHSSASGCSSSSRRPDFRGFYVTKLEANPFFQSHYRALWHLKDALGNEFTDSKFLLGLHRAQDKATFTKELVIGRELPLEHRDQVAKIVDEAWKVLQESFKEYKEKYGNDGVSSDDSKQRLLAVETKVGELETQLSQKDVQISSLARDVKTFDTAFTELKQAVDAHAQQYGRIEQAASERQAQGDAQRNELESRFKREVATVLSTLKGSVADTEKAWNSQLEGWKNQLSQLSQESRECKQQIKKLELELSENSERLEGATKQRSFVLFFFSGFLWLFYFTESGMVENSLPKQPTTSTGMDPFSTIAITTEWRTTTALS